MRKALIVEDEPLIAFVIQEMLEQCHYHIAGVVPTEHEAVAAASDCDVIIMDINLLEGNGLSAARSIRQSSKVPILFCSAYVALPEVRDAILNIPHAAFVEKPIRESDFQRALLGLTTS